MFIGNRLGKCKTYSMLRYTQTHGNICQFRILRNRCYFRPILMQQNQNTSFHIVNAFQMHTSNISYPIRLNSHSRHIVSWMNEFNFGIKIALKNRWIFSNNQFNSIKILFRHNKLRMKNIYPIQFHISFISSVSKVIVSNVQLSCGLWIQMARRYHILEYKHKHKVI